MSKFRRILDSLKFEGVASTSWRVGKWITSRFRPFEVKPLSGIHQEDLLNVDWTNKREFNALSTSVGTPHIAWIISPPSPGSGGHQNAFLFMKFLENAGYRLTVFFYSAQRYPRVSIPAIQKMMAESNAYPRLEADFQIYDPNIGITGLFDCIVCSDWTTAYPSWRYERNVPRIYWVLDFEPSFFPAGSDYVAAENTYRFGFHGITIGPWLATKLASDYGMSTDFYEYAVDSLRYVRTNNSRRNEVLFYARPSTPRRATEFGLLALAELNRLRPDITINIVGASLTTRKLSFPIVNHGVLDISELPDLYNKCASALVLSTTCMSLLPLEVMSCGVIPVVNDAENTRLTLNDDPRIDFVEMSPLVMARHLIDAVDREDQIEHSQFLAETTRGSNWDQAGKEVLAVFDRLLNK